MTRSLGIAAAAAAVVLAACSSGDIPEHPQSASSAASQSRSVAPPIAATTQITKENRPDEPSKRALESQHVAGELLVKFRSGTSRSQVANSLYKASVQSERPLTLVPGLRRVRLAPGVDAQAAMAAFRDQRDVEYVEPNYIVHAAAMPNDPQFGGQWALHNTGQTGGNADADIDAPEAWDTTSGDNGVVVAVLDSGVDYNHEDLAANIFQNTADCNGNGLDDDGNGYVDDCRGIDTANHDSDPMDDFGHGTHVAGIIGAVGNNGLGVSGVAWNLRILPCKFLGADGSGTTADAIECLQYVAAMKDRGVNVVATNNSWGNGNYSQALHDAIRQQMDRGILFVAAAGNDAEDITDSPLYADSTFFPCAEYLPNVICVTSSVVVDGPYIFSNVGRQIVHLAAPGNEILSTLPGNAYGTRSGTSMATPHVTGTVALLKSATPALDWRATKNLVIAGGDVAAPDLLMRGIDYVTISARRLNAYGSLACSNTVVTRRVQPRARVPITTRLGKSLTLAVLNIQCASPHGAVSVTVNPGGTVVSLLDDGNGADIVAGDGIYSATWTAAAAGSYVLDFPGTPAGPGSDHVTVNVDPHLRAGFPVKTFRTGGTMVGQAQIVVGDVDGAGDLEILAPGMMAGPNFAWKSNGHLAPGWPIGGASATLTAGAAFMALGNLSGSAAQNEVAAGFNGLPGSMELYSAAGTLLPGWPRDAANYVSSEPVLADIDGDGIDEIFIGEGDFKLYGYRSGGQRLPGFPVRPSIIHGGQHLSSPLVADVDADGSPELFSESDTSAGGTILGVHVDGSSLTGFPLESPEAMAPIGVGDVDGDGAVEIVTLATKLLDDRSDTEQVIRVFARDGTIKRDIGLPMTGFPSEAQGALADLTGDGIPEIVVTTQDRRSENRRVHVVTGTGVALPGWPVLLTRVAGTLFGSSPVIGDVDGDGLPDVVVVAYGALHVLNHDGTYHSGFPKENPSFDTNLTPAIADIDDDGRNEVIVATDLWTGQAGYFDTLWVYDLGGPATHGAIEWGQYHENSRRQGFYRIGKNLPNQAYLSVQTQGQGTVISSTPGINCGGDCIQLYAKGTSVTLAAAPIGSATFSSWTGACAGQGNPCTITVQQATDVGARFGPYALSVALNGPGAVTSSPAGISCPADCDESYAAGAIVTLTAAGQGGPFIGWSGACAGSALVCSVTMNAAKSVTANFSTGGFRTYILGVNKAGTGAGVVSSTPAGIQCGAICSADFAEQSAVTLSATPDAGSVFTGWSGACSGTSMCSVSISAAAAVTATFALQSELRMILAGTGTGSVTSSPAGIDCGSTCTAAFSPNTVVTLTAAAAQGSRFSAWSGACTGTAATCTITMNDAKTMTASFTSNGSGGSGGSGGGGGGGCIDWVLLSLGFTVQLVRRRTQARQLH